MKTVLGIIAAAIFCNVCMARGEEFVTRFEIEGMPDSTAILARIHDGANYGEMRFDTIYIFNGQAELHDVSRVDDPVRMYVFTPSGTIMTYVKNGCTERISGKASDIYTASLKYEGAPWSNDMMIFNREVEHLNNRASGIARRYQSLSDDEKKELSELGSRIDSLQNAYYRNYPNSWHTLFQLQFQMMDMPKDSVQRLYDALGAEQKQSRYGVAMARYLSTRTIEVGDSLSSFNIDALDQFGNRINLMEIEEPYILLDFSSCYCGPCIAAAKEIHSIKEKYAGKIAFINYSCDDTEQTWRLALKRDAISWPSIYDGQGSGGPVCLKYRVNSFPTFFLFGPERTLLWRQEGYGHGMLDAYLSGVVK